jgi:hypothetical protein
MPATCRIQENVVMREDFILGDSALHQRLCAITEVLGKFVACAPRQLNIWHLAESTGRSERELEKLCVGLARAAVGQYIDPSAAQLSGHRPQRFQHDADLLVMQAAMAINQSVFQHLRQFSLDRLKVSSAAAYPIPSSSRHSSRRSASAV